MKLKSKTKIDLLSNHGLHQFMKGTAVVLIRALKTREELHKSTGQLSEEKSVREVPERRSGSGGSREKQQMEACRFESVPTSRSRGISIQDQPQRSQSGDPVIRAQGSRSSNSSLWSFTTSSPTRSPQPSHPCSQGTKVCEL